MLSARIFMNRRVDVGFGAVDDAKKKVPDWIAMLQTHRTKLPVKLVEHRNLMKKV